MTPSEVDTSRIFRPAVVVVVAMLIFAGGSGAVWVFAIEAP
jgi:hypothetical protein